MSCRERPWLLQEREQTFRALQSPVEDASARISMGACLNAVAAFEQDCTFLLNPSAVVGPG